MSDGFKPRPLKNLFTANQCWPALLEAGGLRDIEVESVTKMLACGTSILGVKQYQCANEDCSHLKCLCNTCKGRACPSCGKKATDQWIATQHERLPECSWQHLVFTLPDTLWPLFFHNRELLNDLCRMAVDNLQYAGEQRGLRIGAFCALHTYGRRLNWHPHVHVSVTCGGINAQEEWKDIAFHLDPVRKRWMWNVRQWLLGQWGSITLPPALAYINAESAWRSLVLSVGGAHWYVYASKKTHTHRKTVNYLGRYLKKPPISGSRLAHYTASPTLEFTYLDHKTQTYQQESLTQVEMLERVIQHIPEKHFRMIRYFGFLANRVCGRYLPVVYRALQMERSAPPPKVYFAAMMKSFLNQDPFRCVLCGSRMLYSGSIRGLTVQKLVMKAREIGLLRYVHP